MIGLQFIARVFDMDYKTIGEKIGVSQQTMQDWLKGRRKIPAARQERLSELFGIDAKYFASELNPEDEIQIQLIHLRRLGRVQGYDIEVPIIQPTHGESEARYVGDPLELVEYRLEEESRKHKLIRAVEGLVNSDDTGSNFFIMTEVTKLLQNDENRSRNIRLLEMLIYFLSYRDSDWGHRPEVDWCVDKEDFFSIFELLLRTYNITV